MIKVLIIEDLEPGYNAAVAGLIPAKKGGTQVGLNKRIKTSPTVFEIQRAKNLDQAELILNDFRPDLCIIDVNLSASSPKWQVQNIIDGIDFYKLIDPKLLIKLLFSAQGQIADKINKLEPEDMANFISKSEGSGYEILANRIGAYLKKVSSMLISRIPQTVVNRVIRELEQKHNIDEVTPIVFGTRTIKLEQLFAYNYIFQGPEGNERLINTTTYEEAIIMLKTNIGKHEEKLNRDIYLDPGMQQFVVNYEKEDAGKNEPIVRKLTTELIEQILKKLQNSSSSSGHHWLDNKRLHFRVTEFIKNKDLVHPKFVPQFVNAMAVRRVLTFFESLFEEVESSPKAHIRDDYEDFYKNFITRLMQATHCSKTIYGRTALSLQCADANLGYASKGAAVARQTVSAKEYVKYDMESGWEGSPEYGQLKIAARHLMVR